VSAAGAHIKRFDENAQQSMVVFNNQLKPQIKVTEMAVAALQLSQNL